MPAIGFAFCAFVHPNSGGGPRYYPQRQRRSPPVEFTELCAIGTTESVIRCKKPYVSIGYKKERIVLGVTEVSFGHGQNRFGVQKAIGVSHCLTSQFGASIRTSRRWRSKKSA